LLVTAATIYMTLLGPDGLRQVAAACFSKAAALRARLQRITGLSVAFTAPHYHEFVIQLDQPVGPVLDGLAADGILGGLSLAEHFPELGNAMLVCATETKTDADLDEYAQALDGQLQTMRART
jgi:glycine dehydrogenase subunit 1